VIVVLEAWRDVIERVRYSADAVQHDERWFVRGTPIEVVNSEIVNGDELILIAGLSESRARANE
jgi:hypothetical protein